MESNKYIDLRKKKTLLEVNIILKIYGTLSYHGNRYYGNDSA